MKTALVVIQRINWEERKAVAILGRKGEVTSGTAMRVSERSGQASFGWHSCGRAMNGPPGCTSVPLQGRREGKGKANRQGLPEQRGQGEEELLHIASRFDFVSVNLRHLSILQGQRPVENIAWWCRVESGLSKDMGAKATEVLELSTETG
ncbi:hypothetical protein HJG60_009122 [Phyllostomus discolor]|uniref:Uncharacterized protein n=1 Tax=Phyllostomus discolor TaxID=89673 RepID=A0A833YRY0_9CHIR|nr:hypothetical protein HJG60_009122 [Phyllostomus discolor]